MNPPENGMPELGGSAMREEVRKELLANEQVLKQIIDLRHPRERPRWFETAGVVALATLLLSSAFNFALQHKTQFDEQRFALKKASLESAQDKIGELMQLIAGLLRAVDDRTKMAQGRYDDLESALMKEVRDSTNAADARWRLGQLTSQFHMQFHFGDNERVMKEWRLTRERLQAYGQCAEITYRQFLRAKAPEGACVSARDSAVAAIDTFIGELLREYRQMEALDR